MNEPKLHLELTVAQGYPLRDALDVYMRLCMGQLEILGEMVRDGTIPMASPGKGDRVMATVETADEVRLLLDQIKKLLGYPSNGSNGVGHPHMHKSGLRSYEIKKAVAQALAFHRDPNPTFKGVDHDGVTVRYTDDPVPVAKIVSTDESPGSDQKS